MTIYVDATNGDDANDGMVPDRALATIQAALVKAKTEFGGTPVTIELAAGTYETA